MWECWLMGNMISSEVDLKGGIFIQTAQIPASFVYAGVLLLKPAPTCSVAETQNRTTRLENCKLDEMDILTSCFFPASFRFPRRSVRVILETQNINHISGLFSSRDLAHTSHRQYKARAQP